MHAYMTLCLCGTGVCDYVFDECMCCICVWLCLRAWCVCACMYMCRWVLVCACGWYTRIWVWFSCYIKPFVPAVSQTCQDSFHLFSAFNTNSDCVCKLTSCLQCCLQVTGPMYHPTPNISRPVAQLTEEEQVKIAKRIGLINQLPTGVFDGTRKAKE